jgi:hypothetical protein
LFKFKAKKLPGPSHQKFRRLQFSISTQFSDCLFIPCSVTNSGLSQNWFHVTLASFRLSNLQNSRTNWPFR